MFVFPSRSTFVVLFLSVFVWIMNSSWSTFFFEGINLLGWGLLVHHSQDHTGGFGRNRRILCENGHWFILSPGSDNFFFIICEHLSRYCFFLTFDRTWLSSEPWGRASTLPLWSNWWPSNKVRVCTRGSSCMMHLQRHVNRLQTGTVWRHRERGNACRCWMG